MEQSRTIMRISAAKGWPTSAGRVHRLWARIKLARRDPHARRGRRVTLMLILLWIANGFDLVFTLLAVRLGGFEEANPIAAPLMGNTGLLAAFKILTVLFASIVILKFRKRLLTEIGCWGLCLTYTLLSAMWWVYYFLHNQP